MPIITKALQATEPKQEIKKAFEQIEHLGQQPEYHQGYMQFQQFKYCCETACKTQQGC